MTTTVGSRVDTDPTTERPPAPSPTGPAPAGDPSRPAPAWVRVSRPVAEEAPEQAVRPRRVLLQLALGVVAAVVVVAVLGALAARQLAEREAVNDAATMAGVIAEAGWHIQVQLNGRELPERFRLLSQLPVDLVIDHVGRFMPPVETDDEPFRTLCRLLDRGHTWVKLSAPYESIRILGGQCLQPPPKRGRYGPETKRCGHHMSPGCTAKTGSQRSGPPALSQHDFRDPVWLDRAARAGPP